jgi:hypothetical protein
LSSTLFMTPNARRQAPPTAGARDERTLLVVACTPGLGDPVRECRLTCHSLTSRHDKGLRSLPLVQALSFDIGLFHSDIAEERRVHHGGIVAEHHQIGTFAQFQ